MLSHRANPLLLLVTLLALLTSVGCPLAVGAEEIQFYVGSSIEAKDAMYIREGIRLGQDYVQEQLGAQLETLTIVNAVPGAPRGNTDLVGLSTSHAVVLYTESDGWLQSAPFDRVHVVVHEYMHVVQQELAGERGNAPLWIDEGVAEYVGYQAVIEAGLVSAADVEAYNAANVVFGPDLPPLSEVERPWDYQSQPSNIYGLSYLAVKQLVGDRPTSIRRYYERLGDGASWRSAFRSAFRINPSDFYEAFEAARSDFDAPRGTPAPFVPPDEAEYPAAVSLGTAPDSIDRGDQLLLVAASDAGVSCTLTVSTRAGRELLSQPTFADTTGLLFWLWTVPDDARRAAVTAAVACGADPVTTPLRIT
ncbi:MAG: hypothetical protein QOF73_5401 [Thermomicrobiales bacterium]|nr:hypothetical protein [Thermomicrobiales bacterium]